MEKQSQKVDENRALEFLGRVSSFFLSLYIGSGIPGKIILKVTQEKAGDSHFLLRFSISGPRGLYFIDDRNSLSNPYFNRGKFDLKGMDMSIMDISLCKKIIFLMDGDFFYNTGSKKEISYIFTASFEYCKQKESSLEHPAYTGPI